MRAAASVVVLAVVGTVAWLAMPRADPAPPPDMLFGHVELRQIDLAFAEAGTVRDMALHEGDTVHAGAPVAELDDAAYLGAQALAVARRDAAQANLDLLLAGTRPEEIERARANVANVQATVARAEATFTRQEDLLNRKVASQQAYDDALSTRDSARAALAQYQAALAEAIAGPRPQEIEAARAELRAAAASVRLAELQLAHVKLNAPVDGVVMARLVEPGTVVQPGAPVYAVAITGEVWVRAFAAETMLGRIAPNTEVAIAAEGGHAWRGRIDTVFPTAEFSTMPADPRAPPVYRVRIRVERPDEALRQGMPVTITLDPKSA
jgi:HlyD family secretion protein